MTAAARPRAAGRGCEPTMPTTTAVQAAAILREILEGSRPLRLAEPRRPWVQVAVGEVACDAGGYRLVFFADSATLDHLASLTPPGGEATTFEQWLGREGTNPVDLLDDPERIALEHLLTEAT